MRIQMAFERYDIVQSNKELTNLLKIFTFVLLLPIKVFIILTCWLTAGRIFHGRLWGRCRAGTQ
jgi:hypothetical protein